MGTTKSAKGAKKYWGYLKLRKSGKEGGWGRVGEGGRIARPWGLRLRANSGCGEHMGRPFGALGVGGRWTQGVVRPPAHLPWAIMPRPFRPVAASVKRFCTSVVEFLTVPTSGSSGATSFFSKILLQGLKCPLLRLDQQVGIVFMHFSRSIRMLYIDHGNQNFVSNPKRSPQPVVVLMS